MVKNRFVPPAVAIVVILFVILMIRGRSGQTPLPGQTPEAPSEPPVSIDVEDLPAVPPVPSRVPELPGLADVSFGMLLKQAPLRVCPPQAAIVIDDLGFVMPIAQAFVELKHPVTLAVFPNLEHSTAIATLARAQGREVIMHLPMESDSSRLNPGTLLTTMSEDEIAQAWSVAHASLPGIVGMNNHQGSIMSTDRPAMARVLQQVKNDRLYFLDSRTSSASVGRATAREFGIQGAENDLFLDNEKDVDYIKNKCRELIRIALVEGEAIGICHAHPTTLVALQEVLPEFDAAGVQLVTLSALVE